MHHYFSTSFETASRLAKQAAKESGVDVKWVHGDMRDLPFESEFDVVINMFTESCDQIW